MSSAPDEGYQRGAGLEAELARERLRSSRLSSGRLLAFGALAAGAALAIFASPWALIAISLPAALFFGFLIFRHGPVEEGIRALEAEALLINERAERIGGRRRERPVPETCEEYARGLEAPPPESFPLEAGVLADLDLLSGPRS